MTAARHTVAKEVEEKSGGASGWVDEARQYLIDVRSEFDKVTWPQRKEAVAGTIGVLIIVAVITLILSLVDVTLAKFVEWVLP
jgi:preprotein translocase subunit SecE